MIGRFARWVSVRFLAWSLRRGVTIEQAIQVIDKSFPHRDQDWRDQLMLDAVASNRKRVMRSIA